MPGYLLNVMPPTLVDFSNLISTASTAQTLVVAQRIDISGVEYPSLLVRVHSVGIGAGNQIEVLWNLSGYTPDEPLNLQAGVQGNTDWSLVGPTLSDIQLQSTQTAPDFKTSQITGAQAGGLTNILIKGTRNSTNSLAFWVRLSIDLSLKTSGVVRAPRASTYMGYGAQRVV